MLKVYDDKMGYATRAGKFAFVRALGIGHASVQSTGVFSKGGCIIVTRFLLCTVIYLLIFSNPAIAIIIIYSYLHRIMTVA